MIDITLVYIRDLLNQHFKNHFSISDNKVVLSNLVESDGSFAKEVDDKVVFFLLGFEEESSLKNTNSRGGSIANGSFSDKHPPLYLNLNLFFCANFRNQNYTEGLHYLSFIISYFQQHKTLVPINSLGLSKRVQKLSFELCKLDYDQLSHIWSSIGSKLLPSALYKVGIVVFDESPITKITPVITRSEEDRN
ncbi:hypothetical protein P872_20240 [Rhodonellum psychrophilum GCM71 = DSM 17998]|uniref:Pvc16 N-terminal domain-containing protein n=2 Tax=Rhodonellum TaxID=336827 RepID=U5BTG9_9BACT|nr:MULTISPECIES: DUF4255 domain-containing protein [Rhodonellum]ERM81218.1 hypothetical protein P872_20240 [Rhodonellum psychrophilum GCM71 = DSM 17998]MDO9554664.1 DUF4255 domain-containing protein [Rhodonellum sp.]SDZ52309.1 Protein of unknown function [Rhodonellum ikkaensis]